MYAQTVLVDCKRNEGKEIRSWRKGGKKRGILQGGMRKGRISRLAMFCF
jgi:hypothetical protein